MSIIVGLHHVIIGDLRIIVIASDEMEVIRAKGEVGL